MGEHRGGGLLGACTAPDATILTLITDGIIADNLECANMNCGTRDGRCTAPSLPSNHPPAEPVNLLFRDVATKERLPPTISSLFSLNTLLSI